MKYFKIFKVFKIFPQSNQKRYKSTIDIFGKKIIFPKKKLKKWENARNRKTDSVIWWERAKTSNNEITKNKQEKD